MKKTISNSIQKTSVICSIILLNATSMMAQTNKTAEGIGKVETWGMTIAQALIGVGFIYAVVKAAMSFFGGDSQRGWSFVLGAFGAVVLFALAPTIKDELLGMFK